MKQYVAGLLFCDASVLLVKKNVPLWQKGLLNAIGGKVEEGETPSEAMIREFREETKIPIISWRHFCSEGGPDYWVHFFKARISKAEYAPHHPPPKVNDVGEELSWELTTVAGTKHVVGNLRWLVPLALDWRILGAIIVETKDRISDRPSW